ncbi:MAG TPA: helix-turn-helix domain-containing protein [Micromonosporaceae bacterium]|jgi:transcriptional regulator with XRE-family HTH domain
MSEDGLPVLPGFRELAERRQRALADLVAQRRAAGLSQADVAARMGTSQPAVARLEAGNVDVRLSTLERYAAAVGGRLHLRLDHPVREARPGRAEGER